MSYKLIDGFPTTRYGVVLEKRCRWCYNTIKSLGSGNRIGVGRSALSAAVWCCKDCKEENLDYNYVTGYVRQKERAKERYHSNTPIKRKDGTILENRKDYFKKYFQEHKEKRTEQMRVITRAYKKRKKLLDNKK